jgi:hypothetical protein
MSKDSLSLPDIKVVHFEMSREFRSIPHPDDDTKKIGVSGESDAHLTVKIGESYWRFKVPVAFMTEYLTLARKGFKAQRDQVPTPPGEERLSIVDNCQVCGGCKVCTPGNENIIEGKRMCDCCHSKWMEEQGR